MGEATENKLHTTQGINNMKEIEAKKCTSSCYISRHKNKTSYLGRLFYLGDWCFGTGGGCVADC